MAPSIVPAAKALYLCDYAIYDHGTNKQDLYGLVDSIRAPSYPHTAKQFCVFAQLTGGLGRVPFHVTVVEAATGAAILQLGGGALQFPTEGSVVNETIL